MKEVTAIEPQAKAGSKRLNIYLDSKFAFGLSEELAARLTPGSFLSEEEVEDLLHQDGLHQVYDAALVLLSYRPRSVAELRRRLSRRGFADELVEEALGRLEKQKVIDDRDFAQFWVENRLAHSPRGGRLLYAELRSKGLDRELITEALPGPEEEESSAYRAAQRKARSLAGEEWREFRRRLGDYLVRRGFGFETASSTARRLWQELNGAAGEDEETETSDE